MELHIGKLIKERLAETGMKKSEFARRINRTSQNVYDIFERKTIDTGLLSSISEILNFNFFEPLANHVILKDHSQQEVMEIQAKFGSSAGMAEALKRYEKDYQLSELEVKHLKIEIDYLKEINLLLKKKIKE
jgi:hypothetical protein